MRRENLGETRCCIRLEARGAEIAEDGIVAGLVALIQRDQCRADQDQNSVPIDLRRCRRRLGRRCRRLLLTLRIKFTRLNSKNQKQTAKGQGRAALHQENYQANVPPTRPPTPPRLKPAPIAALATKLLLIRIWATPPKAFSPLKLPQFAEIANFLLSGSDEPHIAMATAAPSNAFRTSK